MIRGAFRLLKGSVGHGFRQQNCVLRHQQRRPIDEGVYRLSNVLFVLIDSSVEVRSMRLVNQ